MESDGFKLLKSFVDFMVNREPNVAIFENVIGATLTDDSVVKLLLEEVKRRAPMYTPCLRKACCSYWLFTSKARVYIIFLHARLGDKRERVQQCYAKYFDGDKPKRLNMQDCTFDPDDERLIRRLNEREVLATTP